MVSLHYTTIYISLLILDSTMKRLFAQIVTDGKHNFLDCKSHPFTEWDMNKMVAVRFHSPLFGRHPSLQYPHDFSCRWSFKGTDTCLPVVHCERGIRIRDFGEKDCNREFVKIEDGAGGESHYCGHIHPKDLYVKPLRGKDLIVTFNSDKSTDFEKVYAGFSCTATCYEDNPLTQKKFQPLNSSNLVKSNTSDCFCGIDNETIMRRRKRLIGGSALYTPHAWVAAIVNKSSGFPICGGSVVSNEHILTSATCFKIGHTAITADEVEVVMEAMVLDSPYESDDLGQFSYIPRLTREKPDSSMPRFSVESIIFHPSFTVLSMNNDACLLKLSKKIELDGTKATTVCLPEKSSSSGTSGVDFATAIKKLEGKLATLIGYGFAAESSMMGYRLLHQLSIPILPQTQCQDMYRNFQFSEKLICAGTLDDTSNDGCEGDSGDPLVIKSVTDQFQQIGIHSFGLGCVQARYTGTYTLVSEIIDWLKSTIKGSLTCSEESD